MSQTPLAPFVGERSPRLLAVDDDPVNLKMLSTYLVRWGCTVHTASNGADAIAAARSFNPDLILLDIMMPGQSGFEVCELLQADPATRHIPVIFLTAMARSDAKVQGLDVGARDYVTKPFHAGELAARVGSRLQQKYAEDTLRARAAELTAQIESDDSRKPT